MTNQHEPDEPGWLKKLRPLPVKQARRELFVFPGQDSCLEIPDEVVNDPESIFRPWFDKKRRRFIR